MSIFKRRKDSKDTIIAECKSRYEKAEELIGRLNKTVSDQQSIIDALTKELSEKTAALSASRGINASLKASNRKLSSKLNHIRELNNERQRRFQANRRTKKEIEE